MQATVVTGAMPRPASTSSNPSSNLLAELPARLHHYAFVVRDQEVNRHFFEDIIGLPLIATWCERGFRPELQREMAYCHTFYGMADGGALAFFQFDDDAMYQQCKAIEPPVGRYHHIALKVARATFDEIIRRADADKIEHRELDHGYCLSTYMMSPDGLRVEFTVDPDDVDRINAMRRADAHAELKRWLKGDHRTNNEDRPNKDASAM
ncbi:MAG: VOC family protein [Burkholderiales bacterium]